MKLRKQDLIFGCVCLLLASLCFAWTAYCWATRSTRMEEIDSDLAKAQQFDDVLQDDDSYEHGSSFDLETGESEFLGTRLSEKGVDAEISRDLANLVADSKEDSLEVDDMVSGLAPWGGVVSLLLGAAFLSGFIGRIDQRFARKKE